MNGPRPTRREFLHKTGAVASASLLAAAVPDAASKARAAPPSLPVIHVRRNIAAYAPNSPAIASLRKGVKAMMARPASDPTSWIYQANVHGTYDTPVKPNWNQCQHGSFFFFSWHRMYLYWFERILRQASGDPSLALPYWNYTNPASRDLPVVFRQPASTAQNPLYLSQRAPGINTGAQLPPSAVTYSAAFAYVNFFSPTGSGLSFGGQQVPAPAHFTGPHGALESQPHDVVHVLVGGGSGYMSDPNLAARDPIFWLHHANIDRLWKRWLQQGGGRTNPTGNTAWMKDKFTFFDESGNAVTMTGANVLDTVEQLHYRYDDDPPPHLCLLDVEGAAIEPLAPKKKERAMIAESTETGIVLADKPKSVAISLGKAAKERLAKVLSATGRVEEAITLAVEGIDYDKQPGLYYEIYLDLPADAKPDYQDVHYVGNLAFFARKPHGDKEEHGHKDQTQSRQDYNLTGVINALGRHKLWDPDKATVTFVPRGLLDAEGKELPLEAAKVKIAKLRLYAE
jgi:hypothetical protein